MVTMMIVSAQLKRQLSAQESARHSGIVRSANAVARAAKLAKSATDYWKNLVSIWGVQCEYESNGAIWIAKYSGSGKNEKFSKLAKSLANLDIQFWFFFISVVCYTCSISGQF